MTKPLPLQTKIDTSSLLLFLFLFSFAACSKSSNDPDPNPPTGNNCRLDSISGVVTYAGGAYYQSDILTYDNQDRITSYRYSPTSRQEYSYGANGRVNTYDIFSGEVKKEVRVLQYDGQGRISGYTSTPDPSNTTSADELKITYTTPLITFTYLKNGDTLSSRLYHYENGNNIRIEYFLQEYLVKIDSISYGSALVPDFVDKDIVFLSSGTPRSKNLPTRIISYDVTTAKRQWEESYTYEFDSNNRVSKKTTIAQLGDPTLNYRFEQRSFISCR